ncbi:hypothetical protein ACKKBG_A12495 [Auxenochlorella protothecoides x Auxenochlorella symbiontica]
MVMWTVATRRTSSAQMESRFSRCPGLSHRQVSGSRLATGSSGRQQASTVRCATVCGVMNVSPISMLGPSQRTVPMRTANTWMEGSLPHPRWWVSGTAHCACRGDGVRL